MLAALLAVADVGRARDLPGNPDRAWGSKILKSVGGGGPGNFGDMFEQLFGGKNRAAPRQAPARGADIEHPVTLTFEQAARGTMLPLQIESEGKVETIEIKIPPGVNDGSRIRIRGRGQKSQGRAR